MSTHEVVNERQKQSLEASLTTYRVSPDAQLTAATEPMTLDGLINVSAAWDANFTEIRLDADELQFEADEIRYNNEAIRMDQTARTRLFDKIGAPGRYFEKHKPRFQANAFAAHAARGPGTVARHLLRSWFSIQHLDDEIRPIMSGYGRCVCVETACLS